MDKADILTFVNANLHRGETDIDVQIQMVLNDLSNYNLLIATDTDQTLAANDLYLVYPTDFKELVSLVLINSDSVRQAPLEALPEGHRQYRELRDSDSATGCPKWYSEFDKKFWLWRPSNGVYTTEIEHYKYHAQNVSSIEFGDEFTNCIYFGVAFFVACKFKLKDYMEIWGPLYAQERQNKIDLMPEQPYICRG